MFGTKVRALDIRGSLHRNEKKNLPKKTYIVLTLNIWRPNRGIPISEKFSGIFFWDLKNLTQIYSSRNHMSPHTT